VPTAGAAGVFIPDNRAAIALARATASAAASALLMVTRSLFFVKMIIWCGVWCLLVGEGVFHILSLKDFEF
jgi:hypothetical protein